MKRALVVLGMTAAAVVATMATPGAASAAGSCVGPSAVTSRTWTFTSSAGQVSHPAVPLAGTVLPGGGTATVTFRVAPGCANVPFVVATYRDPISGYTEETAAQQVLFASASGVFSDDGALHSLTVALPASSPTAACPNKHLGASTNGGGANGPGEYGSTCDGSRSLNGNGKGNSTGKPCAGCVGNADDKNPPGQAPNGSDHNAGYECDRNHGVGRTNPAHTGCTHSQIDFATGGLLTKLGPNGSGNAYGDGGRLIDYAFAG